MSNPQHEPTMEEILASIRKIISDDASPIAPVDAPQEHATSDLEVLELTHEVDAAPAAGANGASHDLIAAECPPAAHADASAEPAATTTPQPLPEEGIFSEKARKVLSEALAGMAPEPRAAAESPVTAATPGAESVEAVFQRALKDAFGPVFQKWLAENSDMLVERMKPVVRDWLDENFPAMLEHAIRGEVVRATNRSRR